MITGKRLRKTTINVVSQNPPRWDESASYRELIYRANAHQVKINFIMVEDNDLLRCDYSNDPSAGRIWPLARQTHGHIALVRYTANQDTTLLENLFRLGTGYELVSQAASEDCGTKRFNLSLDLFGSPAILTVVQTGEPTRNVNTIRDLFVSFTGADVVTTAHSFYGDLQIFEVESLNPSIYANVQYNNAGNKTCVVKTYAKSPERIFVTFVEDSTLDSGTPVASSNQPTFVALHTGRSDRQKNTPVNMTIATISSRGETIRDLGTDSLRSSNFERLTTNKLACDSAARWSWIQASYTIGRRSFTRAFPFLCYPEISAPTTSSSISDVGGKEKGKEIKSHGVHAKAADLATCLAKPNEEGNCRDKKDESPGATDKKFRTYTVVIGYAEASLAGWFMQFVEPSLTPKDPIPGVWLKQLYIETSAIDVLPLYIGPDFDAWKKALEDFAKSSPLAGRDRKTFYLQDTLTKAWQPLGKTSEKGLTVVYYYVDPSQTDYGYNNRTNAVSNNSTLGDFYKQLQLSKQQVFLFTNYDDANDDGVDVAAYTDPNILPTIFATGGSAFMSGEDAETAFGKIDDLVNLLYSGSSLSLAYQGSLSSGAQTNFFAESGDVLAWSAPSNYELKIFSKVCMGDAVNDPAPRNSFYKFTTSGSFCVRAATKGLTSLILLSSEKRSFKAGFVKTLNDDYVNAVATTGTPHGPSLMVALDPIYTFTNTDPTARTLKRQNCTSQTVTYSLNQLASTGYGNILLNVQEGSTQVAQRFVPFAATDGIDCGTGKFNSGTGGCDCVVDSWTGVDCSLPACKTGVLGTWGTTCNCDGLKADCTTPWNALGDPTEAETWN